MTAPLDAGRVLAQVLQLVRRAAGADQLASLGFVVVNESRQVLNYQLAVMWRDHGAVTDAGRLVAVSGQARPEPQAPFSQWASRLCHALMSEAAADVKPRTVSASAHPALSEDWSQWLPEHALWVPLANGDGTVLGGWLMARPEPWQAHELAVAQELGAHYGLALSNRLRAGRGRQDGARRWWQRYRRWIWGAALLALFIPVRQSVIVPGEVVPSDPFAVRAPMDGVIERLLVQPNQAVEPGTPLLALDEAALRARHAVAGKMLDAAREEYRQSAQMAVTDDRGRLEMALRRGALEEKNVEFDYLSEQLGRVAVRAPRAGVAVFTDADQWTGRAVMQGERIMQLADPAQVELLLRLPVGERFEVPEGTVVTLYPNASPLSSYTARVSEVAYSAEPDRDGRWSYRIRAVLDGDQPLPRIGTSGSARIQGGWMPLSFFALRRPLTVMRQWSGL